MIPREEGEGVGPKDAGDGALKAPLGELAACKFPDQRHHITWHTQFCSNFSYQLLPSFKGNSKQDWREFVLALEGLILYMHDCYIFQVDLPHKGKTSHDIWLEEWHFSPAQPLPKFKYVQLLFYNSWEQKAQLWWWKAFLKKQVLKTTRFLS